MLLNGLKNNENDHTFETHNDENGITLIQKKKKKENRYTKNKKIKKNWFPKI